MADYYVAKNGNNGNPGSLASPFLDLSYALSVSAMGDRIFIRTGVYTDVWPANDFLGKHIESYQGEDVTIDCEGTRDYVTDAPTNQGGTFGSLGLRLIGLKFVNYNVAGFQFDVIPGSSGGKEFTLLRLFWRASSNSGTFAHDLLNAFGGTLPIIRIENNTFIGHHAAGVGLEAVTSFINNAFKGNTYNWVGGPGVDVEAIENIDPSAPSSVKDHNAYPDNTIEDHGIDSTSAPFSFNNEGSLDYSLPANSALRGAGFNGANIGAPFNPHVLYDSDFALLLSGGINDEAWYDTNLNQPGVDGPVDAAPAIFSGGRWKIDNVAEPGGKSAQVKIGPFNLPAGSVLRLAGWSGIEDTAPATGSRQVIDFTSGTTTRDIRISINGGAKTTLTKTTAVDQPASDVTFYITLRADGA